VISLYVLWTLRMNFAGLRTNLKKQRSERHGIPVQEDTTRQTDRPRLNLRPRELALKGFSQRVVHERDANIDRASAVGSPRQTEL
jgi:hypothetical protein